MNIYKLLLINTQIIIILCGHKFQYGTQSKKTKEFTTEQVEAVFNSDKNNEVGVKLYAILQLCRGYSHSSRKLTEFYHVSHKQICNRADRFDAEGIGGLRRNPRQGRHRRLTREQRQRSSRTCRLARRISATTRRTGPARCCTSISKRITACRTGSPPRTTSSTGWASASSACAGAAPNATRRSTTRRGRR